MDFHKPIRIYMVVLILGVKNPTIELYLWHVKYLGHGAAGNVITGIGVI